MRKLAAQMAPLFMDFGLGHVNTGAVGITLCMISGHSAPGRDVRRVALKPIIRVPIIDTDVCYEIPKQRTESSPLLDVYTLTTNHNNFIRAINADLRLSHPLTWQISDGAMKN